MKTIVELITPEKALEYLSFNYSNRTLRKTHVAALASEMKRGNFQCTHQGIAFNDKGVLIDGQHRLHAVLLSKVSVELQVTRGVKAPDHLSLKIDLSARRSASDLMMMSPKVASVLTVLARMMNGWQPQPISYIEQCSKVFREDVEIICNIPSSNYPLINTSTVKAAAVAMLTFSKSDYSYYVMTRLNSQMYDNMSPVEHAYCKMALARSYNIHDMYSTFVKSLSVFDERNKNANKIYLSDVRFAEVKDAVMDRMREAQHDGD